ncbi:MAG: hypothetical protein ISR00_07370 [Flavobacteriales bacterium]|jgi:hypothetical protein|nr:hypothetical protein [Flavobacteriales bacterium]
MNLKHLFSALFLASFTLVSCGNKCVDCADCPDDVTIDQSELCESDFDNKDEYDQAIAVIEAFGCECK